MKLFWLEVERILIKYDTHRYKLSCSYYKSKFLYASLFQGCKVTLKILSKVYIKLRYGANDIQQLRW